METVQLYRLHRTTGAHGLQGGSRASSSTAAPTVLPHRRSRTCPLKLASFSQGDIRSRRSQRVILRCIYKFQAVARLDNDGDDGRPSRAVVRGWMRGSERGREALTGLPAGEDGITPAVSGQERCQYAAPTRPRRLATRARARSDESEKGNAARLSRSIERRVASPSGRSSTDDVVVVVVAVAEAEAEALTLPAPVPSPFSFLVLAFFWSGSGSLLVRSAWTPSSLIEGFSKWSWPLLPGCCALCSSAGLPPGARRTALEWYERFWLLPAPTASATLPATSLTASVTLLAVLLASSTADWADADAEPVVCLALSGSTGARSAWTTSSDRLGFSKCSWPLLPGCWALWSSTGAPPAARRNALVWKPRPVPDGLSGLAPAPSEPRRSRRRPCSGAPGPGGC
ncbi:hypothetical protein DMC30DRAFT_293532 [Rhodotorula diobovata]|uniref:Uncharacterized protein n=1 Tax=Rhodotorula diobovata TaxID=5288 RepID=A0A5C5FSN3_9BASI|nr:hypothetical protein DMC30DRAFT_293532 [Rhodotorula diobovata]